MIHRLTALLALTRLVVAADARAQSLSATLPDERRVIRLEQWLQAVFDHDPGTVDRAASFVALWPGMDLEKLSLDVNVLASLMRNPKIRRFTVKQPDGRAPLAIRYTDAQLDRIRVLATALECGTPGANLACREIALLASKDAILKRLLLAAQVEPREDGDNSVLRRGALLHTDIMVLVPASDRGADDRPPSAASVRIEFNDGQQQALKVGPIHWEIARTLLDAVKPRDLERPAPERDAWVRRWYHATASWHQANEEYEPDHLDHGRQIFPDDPVLQFYSGTLHEVMAGPEVQTMIRGVALPVGVTVNVKSARAEARQAEGFFRRALELDATMTETRLRFGHVLLMQEHYAEAAAELQKVVQARTESLLEFYAQMFLGAAQEGLGKTSEATDAYAAAATLYPTSQSPRIALSALARRRGNHDEAWRAMQAVFALPNTEPDRDDPWWTYERQQGRDAELLLAEVRQPLAHRAER